MGEILTNTAFLRQHQLNRSFDITEMLVIHKFMKNALIERARPFNETTTVSETLISELLNLRDANRHIEARPTV